MRDNRWMGKIGLDDILKPGYADCPRCGTNWGFVKSHSVRVHLCSESDRRSYWERNIAVGLTDEIPPRWKDFACGGLFALCEQCWSELTPDERLPYWRDLWFSRQSLIGNRRNGLTDLDIDLIWEEIQTNILAGA